ncbi:hypothetical protein T10_4370 [Trichinella papuae]|uniref:Uncharacterized protein n=1 Tax=Trichinella papuae TaxID=268474 RepID=A0A0V1N1G8_9BILA|nr:hypothetical protein T10_4370 [Trichinella papuae]
MSPNKANTKQSFQMFTTPCNQQPPQRTTTRPICNRNHTQPTTATCFRLPTVLRHRSSGPNVPATVAECNSVVDHDQLPLSSFSSVDSGILQASSASRTVTRCCFHLLMNN